VFLTINLPDIIESALQCDLSATGLKFKAKAGKYVDTDPLRKIKLNSTFNLG
jgi:hypothetical protein